MNRMISLAKIIFAGLGICFAITLCVSIIQSVIFIFQNKYTASTLGQLAVGLLLSLAMLAAVVWFLFIKGDYWARKLIVKDIDTDKPQDFSFTLAMAFRLVCIGVGLFCVSSLFYEVSRIASQIMMSKQYSDEVSPFGMIQLSDYIHMTLFIALTVYLLCGAPHFVRWQVKKTLKLCGQA